MVQPSEQGTKGKSLQSASKPKATRAPRKGRRGGRGIAKQLAGDTEAQDAMRLALIEKAWGYRVKGYSPREIADAIADEFNITSPIHHKTIYTWLDEGRAMVTRKIGLHREEHIETVIPRTEAQIRHWLPKATGQSRFAVARMEKVNGELIEVIDENVFKEEAKAAEIVLKTLEQQRKVLGIGLATSESDTDNKAASLTQINVLLQQVINNHGAQPGAALGQTPLTLEAGDVAFEGI